MDLAQKLGIAKQAIQSIVQHEDEDAAVRNSILDMVEQHIAAVRADMNRAVKRRIEALTNPRPTNPIQFADDGT